MAKARKPPFLVCCSANVESLMPSPPDRCLGGSKTGGKIHPLKTTRCFSGRPVRRIENSSSMNGQGSSKLPSVRGHHFLDPKSMVIFHENKPMHEVGGWCHDPMMEGPKLIRQPQGRFVPHVDAVAWACKNMYTYPLNFNVPSLKLTACP